MAWCEALGSLLLHFSMRGACKKGKQKLTKLEDRNSPMVFIGYEHGPKGLRFYDLATERVHVSHDMAFEEDHAWN
jgi:hypothetical protein